MGKGWDLPDDHLPGQLLDAEHLAVAEQLPLLAVLQAVGRAAGRATESLKVGNLGLDVFSKAIEGAGIFHLFGVNVVRVVLPVVP